MNLSAADQVLHSSGRKECPRVWKGRNGHLLISVLPAIFGVRGGVILVNFTLMVLSFSVLIHVWTSYQCTPAYLAILPWDLSKYPTNNVNDNLLICIGIIFLCESCLFSRD